MHPVASKKLRRRGKTTVTPHQVRPRGADELMVTLSLAACSAHVQAFAGSLLATPMVLKG